MFSPPIGTRALCPVRSITAFGGCPRLWSAPAQETVFRFPISSQAPWTVLWCQNYWHSAWPSIWTATKFLQEWCMKRFQAKFLLSPCCHSSCPADAQKHNREVPGLTVTPVTHPCLCGCSPSPTAQGRFVPLPRSRPAASLGCAPGFSHHLE